LNIYESAESSTAFDNDLKMWPVRLENAERALVKAGQNIQ